MCQGYPNAKTGEEKQQSIKGITMAHIVVNTVDGNSHDLPNHEFQAIMDGEIFFGDLSSVKETELGASNSGLSFELKDVDEVKVQ